MHTALLSARKRTSGGALRAARMLAGRSVLAWQAKLARELGCERIVCLCDAPTGEILDLQREIEAAGGEFHVVRTSIQLVALLRSDDTLVIVADGLIIDADVARSITVGEGKLLRGVFSVAADEEYAEQHPEDFERIDAQHRWAGLAIMRASQAQKLADLPPDGEVLSLLLRLALQARTELREVAFNEGSKQGWVLAADEQALAMHEEALIDRAAPSRRWSGPLSALAGLGARFAVPSGLRSGELVAGIVAVLLLLAGPVLGVFGLGVVGLAVVAIGALAADVAKTIDSFARNLLGRSRFPFMAAHFSSAVDILAIATLITAMIDQSIVIWSIPLFTIGLLRLAGSFTPAPIAPFWNDRGLHLAVFAICAVYGVLGEALAVTGLLALLQALASVSSRLPGSTDKSL
ncbi:hypothetical protein ACI5KX_08545 [Erythrobacter sp. GH1-10]|uniref:hypothetical protein n=1 Tax=Erythrobacter sp. GH1-10 TaxID=3349334 RepID=UPI003877A15A